jgi:hypothetical protein
MQESSEDSVLTLRETGNLSRLHVFIVQVLVDQESIPAIRHTKAAQ